MQKHKQTFSHISARECTNSFGQHKHKHTTGSPQLEFDNHGHPTQISAIGIHHYTTVVCAKVNPKIHHHSLPLTSTNSSIINKLQFYDFLMAELPPAIE